MSKKSKGKVAIITGASRGIGKEMSHIFARNGLNVVCVARTKSVLDELVSTLKSDNLSAISICCDVSNEEEVKKMVGETVKEFGQIDVLVNNAGGLSPVFPFQDFPLDVWLDVLRSHLTSSFLCSRYAAAEMMKSGGGSILFISSFSIRVGNTGKAAYDAAKAGQIGLMHGLARELGRHNITVNAIAPGPIEGGRLDEIFVQQAQKRGLSVGDIREEIMATPLRRISTAKDVGELAFFLTNDFSRNISGQCIFLAAGNPASYTP